LRSETRFEKGGLTMKKSWMCVAMLAVAAALVLGAGIATAGPVEGRIYWQFDDDYENNADAKDVLLGRDLDYLGGTRITADIDPVPNPDDRTKFDDLTHGDSTFPKDNPYAVRNPQFRKDGINPALQMLTTEQWTLEGWFRRDGADAAASATIAATYYYYDDEGTKTLNPGWGLRMTPNSAGVGGGIMVFEARPGVGADPTRGYLSKASYADNTWHHFAITWDGSYEDEGSETGYMQLYLDGVLQADGPGAGARASTKFSVGMQINDFGESDDNLWGGDLDEFRYTESVLVPNQFLNYATQDTPIPEPAGLGLLGLALLGLRKRRS
jgi:MYXO-CTERM domain-containing protein